MCDFQNSMGLPAMMWSMRRSVAYADMARPYGPRRMSEAAALLGRMGGKKGGPKGGRARAKKLSAERRREIARKAAQARWGRGGKKRSREEKE